MGSVLFCLCPPTHHLNSINFLERFQVHQKGFPGEKSLCRAASATTESLVGFVLQNQSFQGLETLWFLISAPLKHLKHKFCSKTTELIVKIGLLTRSCRSPRASHFLNSQGASVYCTVCSHGLNNCTPATGGQAVLYCTLNILNTGIW